MVGKTSFSEYDDYYCCCLVTLWNRATVAGCAGRSLLGWMRTRRPGLNSRVFHFGGGGWRGMRMPAAAVEDERAATRRYKDPDISFWRSGSESVVAAAMVLKF
jgi:hypothetical protein